MRDKLLYYVFSIGTPYKKAVESFKFVCVAAMRCVWMYKIDAMSFQVSKRDVYLVASYPSVLIYHPDPTSYWCSSFLATLFVV